MLNYQQLWRVKDPPRHTVQRGARSERVRPTGGFREAVNQQNPLKPGVRELPIPNRPGQQVRQGEGNRTDGRSPVRRYLTNSEVGEAVERLVERRRPIDGCASGTSGTPEVSRRESLQGPEVGIHTG